MVTELLYLKNSYAKQFEATVVKVDGRFVILDKTLFYPQSGRQPSDTGTLVCNGREYKVLFAKKVGQDISHDVDGEGIKQGDLVVGFIDWGNRYQYMRHHTACHILSAVVNQETNALITGNQISLEKARIDFDIEEFDRDFIDSILEKVNEIIFRELDIEINEMSREEAFEIPSVLKLKNVLPPAIENIRVVNITGVDAQACGGTHVANTKEIGKIAIKKVENKGKNNRRIVFVLKE